MADDDGLLRDDDGLRTSRVAVRRAQHCPDCSSRFSSEARFCPYDGNQLVPAPDYDPLADPLLGRVIDDRYAVIRVLGEGGMGTVYEVRHQKLERHFALKALRRDLARDAELSQRFIQEARATAAVTHPGIVQITDFGTLDTQQPYFVMELLRGQPLTIVLHEEGPLEARRALTIVRSLADALKAAHAARIIHRDLKPDNIHVLASPSGRESVKILDFGLARVGSGSRLTKDGFVFGTPHYMSPEQASGEPIDHRADMYSLGVLMYEIFTGTLPFEADTSMGVLTKHIYMDPVRPTEITAEPLLDGALERIILKCLAKQPKDRFADMDDLLRHLESVDGGRDDDRPSYGDRPSQGGLLSRVSEPPKVLEIGWVSWLAGAAGLAALALAGALLIGPSGEPESRSPQLPRVRSLEPKPPTPVPPREVSEARTARPASAAQLAPPQSASAEAPVSQGKPPLRSRKAGVPRPPARRSASTETDTAPTSEAPTPGDNPRISGPRSVPPRAAPLKEIVDPWAQ